jgi:hypothetical protein
MEELYVDTSRIAVRPLNKSVAAAFIAEHHYTHKSSSCRYALGIFYVEEEHSFFAGSHEKLIGCMTYGHPVSNRAVGSLTKTIQLELDNVLELTRLVVFDGYGKNIESYFIGQSFQWLKQNAPEVKILISYADPEQEHTGGIYRATNWLYQGCGYTKLMPDYSIKLFEHGEWIHSRTVAEKFGHKAIESLANRIGHTFWRKEETSKHRYIYFLCNKHEKKRLISDIKIPIFPYGSMTKYTQLIQKVHVKGGVVTHVEVLQGVDNGWANKQGVLEDGEEES